MIDWIKRGIFGRDLSKVSWREDPLRGIDIADFQQKPSSSDRFILRTKLYSTKSFKDAM